MSADYPSQPDDYIDLPTSATDPLWVDVDERDAVQVIMLAGHFMAYQLWLRRHGLHVFQVAEAGDEMLAAYAVSPRAWPASIDEAIEPPWIGSPE